MKTANFIWSKLRAVSSAFAVAAVIAASLYVESAVAHSGVVLDEATKKPLAGVFVYAMWYAEVWNPVIAKSDRCIAHAITQTDDNGKFKLQDFSWNFEFWMTGRKRVVDYYIAGYHLVDENTNDPPIVYMRRYTGSALKRLERIGTIGGQACLAARERKILLPLYKARYEEAKMIADSSEEKLITSYFKNAIEELELGEKEYKRRQSIILVN